MQNICFQFGETKQQNMKFETQWKRGKDRTPEKFQTFTTPGKTVPNESMTVQQMMERQARGLPVTGGRVPIYHGEDRYFPDLEKLDYAEKHRLLKDATEKVAEIQTTLSNKKRDQEKAAKEAEKQKIREELKKEFKNAGDVSQHAQKKNQGSNDE